MLRLTFACLLLCTSIASACGFDLGQTVPESLTGLNSPDPAVVAQSVAMLRGAGPAGLAALLAKYDSAPDPKLIPAIEAVAGQRGALVSRLFWYTDFEQARAAAKAANKPILYLRLMGKLTDEYSCANSRFFRTVLYSNASVSRIMRDQFVLVWISERPVPVVTIDYGDGRVLKRTLTGNSIHYILDVDGRVVDAMPGLVGPRNFIEALMSARGVALPANDKQPILSQYWARTDDALLRNWQMDLGLASVQPAMVNGTVSQVKVAAPGRNPPAPLAMRLAVSKSAVETPLLAQVLPDFAGQIAQSIDAADAATWEKVASRHLEDARLDSSSIAVIQSQNPKLAEDHAALDRMVDHFQHLIALDTVHNNFQFRRKIIAWLRESPGKLTVEELNQRVYSELFLTPRSDPWLGLTSADTYSALCDDGCAVANH